MEARTLLEEVQGEERGFMIRGDKDAEYALTVIRQEQQEVARIELLAEAERQRVARRVSDMSGSHLGRIAYYEAALKAYLEAQDIKPTKSGMRSLSFINGKVSIKPQAPEFKRDEAALGQWFHDSGMSGYFETQYKPKWGDFKREYRDHIAFMEDGTVCVDGEIITGVVAVEREEKFTVEVD